MTPDIFLVAFIGGAIHALLSIRKYNLSTGQLASIVIDGIIGIMTAAAFLSVTILTGNAELWSAGIAGYVGADVVNSLVVIKIRQTTNGNSKAKAAASGRLSKRKTGRFGRK